MQIVWGDGDGNGNSIPLPNVGVPDKDQVLDGTESTLLGIPGWGWTIIAALLLAVIAKALIRNLNFKLVSGVLLIVCFVLYFRSH